MEVGVHFFNQTLSGGPGALSTHLRDTVEAAEDAGCTMFTCMDHHFQMEAFRRAEDPMREGYTSLGYGRPPAQRQPTAGMSPAAIAARSSTSTVGDRSHRWKYGTHTSSRSS
jgi:alkanesulfonate monooxygenase SsuD/methylene tetrahydromethanopterin reductase-like flavin-dependent oxidoreductase (luciferase family)